MTPNLNRTADLVHVFIQSSLDMCASVFYFSVGGLVCEDKSEYCGANPGWFDVTWCSRDYVLASCPKFCGTCTP